MGKRIGKLVGVVAFLLCFVQVPLFAESKSVLSNVPDEDAWVTDGPVYAVVRNEKKGITYIGGYFSYVGPNTGYGVPIDTETGKSVSKFPRVNGEIYAVVSDGSGGWYIGGKFTKVGKEERNCLAHIKKDGTVDKDWNPGTDYPGVNLLDGVYALAVSSDGKTLYVGGSFTTIGGNIFPYYAQFSVFKGDDTIQVEK